jgi:predicted RNase H-like nuclease (RuvC/YqgF family)
MNTSLEDRVTALENELKKITEEFKVCQVYSKATSDKFEDFKIRAIENGKRYAKEVAEKNATIKKLQKKLRAERAKNSKLTTPGKQSPLGKVPKHEQPEDMLVERLGQANKKVTFQLT